jgi:hypothetical protein
MPNKVKSLPLRKSDDGKWEVENVPGKWIKCETEEDAKTISNAPIVLDEFYKVSLPNERVAAKLDKTAEILKQYRISDYRFFRAMTKRARGKKNGRK